jgi:hypothetical protein
VKNILYVGNTVLYGMSHSIPILSTKAILKAGNQVYLFILVNFLAPGPDPHSQNGSGSPDSQINADPCGSGSATLVLT